MPAHPCRKLWLMALLLGCLPVFAHADPVADLDSPDYAVRVAATEALLTDAALTADQVRDWFNQPLSLEQRHRLLDVARHLILRDLAAGILSAQPDAPIALGFELQATLVPDPDGQLTHVGDDDTPSVAARLVARPRIDADLLEVQLVDGQRQLIARDEAGDILPTLANVPLARVVLVVNTLPGLPAHGRLRPGDLIVAVNSKSLHAHLAQADFAQLIASCPPGQPLHVDLLRDGKLLAVAVPTSSFNVLTYLYENQPGTPARLRSPAAEAWQHFLDSLPSSE